MNCPSPFDTIVCNTAIGDAKNWDFHCNTRSRGKSTGPNGQPRGWISKSTLRWGCWLLGSSQHHSHDTSNRGWLNLPLDTQQDLCKNLPMKSVDNVNEAAQNSWAGKNKAGNGSTLEV